jgi:hypothetical protein
VSGNLPALEPAVPDHPMQERVERPRADLIAMAPQLFQYPLAVNGCLAGVMEDVHLPEAEQDFARGYIHLRSLTITDIDYRL